MIWPLRSRSPERVPPTQFEDYEPAGDGLDAQSKVIPMGTSGHCSLHIFEIAHEVFFCRGLAPEREKLQSADFIFSRKCLKNLKLGGSVVSGAPGLGNAT